MRLEYLFEQQQVVYLKRSLPSGQDNTLSGSSPEPRELRRFTGYSREFISAIGLNMQNNKWWIEGQYDTSTWLSAEGTIDPRRFWDHIEVACGSLWMPNRATKFSIDSCKIYWDERSRPAWRNIFNHLPAASSARFPRNVC